MTALGLHLKTNGFVAAELQKSKNSPTLLKAADVEISGFHLDTSNDESLYEYIDHLKEFLYDNNFKSSSVVCGLPQAEVFVRTVKVPPMNKKDLDNFIKYESGQYIPLPLEEVTIGYEQMPPDIAEKNKMSVLLVAAKKSVVEKYIRIVKQAGLTPIALEPESLSMTRALGSLAGEGRADLVVDIGPDETLIILSYKSYVVLTRTIPVGESLLLKTLEQQFNLGEEQARQYTYTYGLDHKKAEGKVREVLKPFMDRIIDEIKRSKTFFTTHNPNVRVDKIIVSGETALMPGLLVYLVDSFNVEVELANPWSHISLESVANQKEVLMQRGPVFSVAAGLALREVL